MYLKFHACMPASFGDWRRGGFHLKTPLGQIKE